MAYSLLILAVLRRTRCSLPFAPHAFASSLLALTLLSIGYRASAAQTDISISMAAPAAAPKITSPTILAGKPGTPFLYTIAAVGQAPLSFSATGVPTGLALASATGTISGTLPAAGSYPMVVTVSNSAGSAQATLTLVSGETLALTPPLGWNSYDSFGAGVTESEVMAAAQAQKALLQPYGWNYVVVDYLWFDPEQVIDTNGRFQPSTSRFPSAAGGQGLKSLADRVHALGLNFGIHIMRGIPRKTVSANSTIAGTSYRAADAGNTSDACPWNQHMWGVRGDTAAGQAWYDSIFAQYAEWGIDFVKVDDMVNNTVQPLIYHQAEVDAIKRAIDKTGRSIVLSLSPGPMQTRDSVNLNQNANMWRTVNDFWDTNGLSTLTDVFAASAAWQGVSGLTPGHWPDADMLPLGYLGPRCPVHAAGPTALTNNEQITVMSLWSIMPSPLMFGGNVPALGTHATGPFTLALLNNPEVLAVNQDALGTHAKRLSQQGTTEVWRRELSGGRQAVALFNRGTQDAIVSVTFAALGVSGTPAIRDLWRRTDVTGMTTSISVNVPYRGALMYLVAPANTGGGGAGGVGGTGGVGTSGGGALAAGGTTAGTSSAGAGVVPGGNGGGGSSAGGVGGAGNVGGTVGAGGASTMGGTSASGGTTAAGGTLSTGGSATSGGTIAGVIGSGGALGGSSARGGASAAGSTIGSSSCACRAVGNASSGQPAIWASLLLLLTLRKRRSAGTLLLTRP